ncbi:MAG: CopD family protein [Nitrososphaerota archaeon]|nr:CopD family protein [Nitrososphaerota archaeon]
MITIFLAVLWLHLFAAIIFIGGSFFIWLVVWPASYDITSNEAERTKIVGKIAKRFAYFTHASIVTLVLSGIYLAFYVSSPAGLLSTFVGNLLLTKITVVIVMIALMYFNNLYHGKKIMKLASQGKLDEVKRVRRLTHIASYVTLALLILITILGAALVVL